MINFLLQYSPPDENPTKKETTHSALLNGNSHENNKNNNKKKPSKSSAHAESGKEQHNNHSVNRKKAKSNKSNATNKKKKEKPTTIEQFNSRRRKLWAAIMKKEISKGQKARNFNQKERISNRKRMAGKVKITVLFTLDSCLFTFYKLNYSIKCHQIWALPNIQLFVYFILKPF